MHRCIIIHFERSLACVIQALGTGARQSLLPQASSHRNSVSLSSLTRRTFVYIIVFPMSTGE